MTRAFHRAGWRGGPTKSSVRHAFRAALLATTGCLSACTGSSSPAGPTPLDVAEAGREASSAQESSPIEDSNVALDAGSDAFDEPVDDRDAADAPSREHLPAPDPYPRPGYVHLSETGFFSAPSVPLAPAADLLAFEPTYPLWSDGAAKRRWVRLPPGTSIDTSDMDHWVFPVGTKVWKEFARNGILLETRLIERYGTGPEDYWMGSFVWNSEQTDAVFAVDGQQDINGTAHDAPAQTACGACHRGDAGRVLGLSALQMSRQDHAPTLGALDRAGLLSVSPSTPIGITSDPLTTSALGYLHANCGHCHNEHGTSWPDTQMVLRLRVAEHDPASSDLYRSTVGVEARYWRGGVIASRISAGEPDGSAIVARMKIRVKDQMPPLATEQVDETGLQLLRDWIAALPR